MRANEGLTLPTVLAVDGDLVDAEVTRLAERLWPHLLTAPPETLVDLAQATTLDTAGLDLLVAARTYAAHRHIPLHLINAAPRVHRELHTAAVRALPSRSRRAELNLAPQHDAAVPA
ncbi:anti-sigma factor antagonist [Saccharopolyspora karakumensis]|uniref:Anti-sigma factor antagonist n=1 Tax=Saccharopolyspora karakumensis TaxID=2530386 RepID=A0A4R5BSA2_9PSEU|nr:STAS domain-containing protein [Saccharopolyspora karakumensis]TDD86924.1 anti-sigma factor antagonist [Saccharopolyspora karakumensis]